MSNSKNYEAQNRRKARLGLLALCLVSIFIGVMYAHFSSGESSTTTNDDGTVTMTKNSFGCIEKTDTQNLMDFATTGDRGMFESYLATAIGNGNCIAFNEGEKAYLKDVEFSGPTQILLKRNSTRYWVADSYINLSP